MFVILVLLICYTVSEKVSQDEQQQQQHQLVEMEVYPGSPGQFLQESPDKSTGQHLLLDPGTTRVCVITSVVVNTPSVVVCSVDVEPCSVLNKSIVSSQALPVSTYHEYLLSEEKIIIMCIYRGNNELKK